MSAFEVAQLNIGVIRAPMDSPLMADFANGLERINALADATPGFVWRLQSEAGDATSIRPFDADNVLVNMSVWQNIEALTRYVYHSAHVEFVRRRREWFEPMKETALVLWWVRSGHQPSISEGVARLELLRKNGPTPEAFTFRHVFPAPDAP